MLQLPTRGIAPSIKKHNCSLDVFGDWLEGSVLFSGGQLSDTDVVDALIDNKVYDKQDFANEWIGTSWGEVKRRQKAIPSGSPFDLQPSTIASRFSWKEVPAHSFCVLLSLVNNYSGLSDKWKEQFKAGYNEQGELFELLTKESLEKQFIGWSFYHTGWTRAKARKLKVIVADIQTLLGETPGNLLIWASPDANEAGLDLLCYRPFADNRVGIPVYLLQCASGDNWKTKVHSPDINQWTKIIQFAAHPTKAFSTPYAIEDNEFKRYCGLVNGLFLDRYRLLMPTGPSKDWLSDDLRARLIAWIEPRISTLPVY